MTDLGFMNCRKKGSPFKYLFLLKGTPFDEQTQAAAEKREDLNLGTESEPKIVRANQWHTQPRRERTDCGYQKRGR